jgi:hypothetical protein
MKLLRPASALLPVFLATSTELLAQIGSTVPNWTVPPYTASRADAGLTTMTDFTPPVAFVAVTPCRVVDTRNPAGPYGGPALSTNVARTFDIDNGPCAGLPGGIDAYSLSFGAILPPADGFLTAWPTGTAQPVFSQVNLIAGEVVANAAIVPAGTNGAINVFVNIGPTHIYIDINGYFSDSFGVQSAGFLVISSGPYAISGYNLGTGSGVFGGASSGIGVEGSATSGTGVLGSSAGSGFGVQGVSGSGFGVQGYTGSTGFGNKAGVLGINGNIVLPGVFQTAGVRGESPSHGVLGFSTSEG